jgi:hypothetical protein
MDDKEAVWLASAFLREWFGTDYMNWEPRLEVEVREQGWVVSFRHVGDFAPTEAPWDRRVYVFRDSTVEMVRKIGPQGNESNRQLRETS